MIKFILFPLLFFCLALYQCRADITFSTPSRPPFEPQSRHYFISSYTGRTFNWDELTTRLRAAGANEPDFFLSQKYAEVSHDWLLAFQRRFKTELTRYGIKGDFPLQSGWTETWECGQFVQAFRVFAALEYDQDIKLYRPANPAPALAIIWINYTPDTEIVYAKSKKIPIRGHAIVAVLTDVGVIFVDPQVGEVHLSEAELKSIFFVIA